MSLQRWLSGFFAVVSLCMWVGAASAQPREDTLRRLSWQSWNRYDGLPQVSVTAIAHGADGRIWAGTENGLVRFDGSSFDVFDSSDVPALKANWITQLLADRNGDLWIGTIKNLLVNRKGRFIPVNGLASGRINGLAQDTAGNIWVAGNDLFKVRGDKLEPVPGWAGTATAVVADEGGIWVGGQGRVVRISREGWRILLLPAALRGATVASMAWSSGTLWLATSKGLVRMGPGGFEILPLEEGNQPNLQGIALSDAFGLLTGSDKALYRIDGHNGKIIERLTPDDLGIIAWPISFLPEKDGLWVGSKTDGLRHYWRDAAVRFGPGDGLSNSNVWSFWANRDEVLIGTNSGVAQLQGNNISSFIGPEALPNPVAYSILRDRLNRLWVGTRAGLARFDEGANSGRVFPEFEGLQINGLVEGSENTIYAATSEGLFRINNDIVRDLGPNTGALKSSVRYVMEVGPEDFWVGTESGLFHYKHGKFMPIIPKELGNVMITAMLPLADGRLIVGTYDYGLYVVSRGGHWWRYTKDNNLPSLGIYFLGQYKNWLIASGPDGVYRFPLAALKAPPRPDTALPVDVLLNDHLIILGRAAIRCCNGAGNGKGAIVGDFAYLPSLAGVVRVDLSMPRHEAPHAVISAYAQGDRKRPASSYVTLKDGDRNVTFTYGAVDFRDGPLLQFRYRLKGFDKEWNEVSKTRSANYTNLPPGRFTFEVQARRMFERWGPSATVQVYTPERFVETWSFRGFVVLALILAVFGIVRWRERRLKRQKNALESIVQERTEALAATNAQLEQANEALKLASNTDPLTGLRNRRFMDNQIGTLMAQVTRERAATPGKDLVLGLLLVDIDHFKQLNDRLGHSAGDTTLREISAVISGTIREGEYALRWGGEEFLLLLGATPRDALPMIAERLRRAVGEARLSQPVTVSIGLSAWPVEGAPSGHTWETALELADHGLYAAKAAGRNRCAYILPGAVPPGQWPAHIGANDIARWRDAGLARVEILEQETGATGKGSPGS